MKDVRNRLSAGVVIFKRDAAEPRCLLLRAFRNWDFPKGTVELGESPFAAAQREVREETGLAELDFPCGEAFQETGLYNRGKVARYYFAWSREAAVILPVNPLLGRPEHHEFRWVDCAAAAALIPDRLQPILAWACDKAKALQRARRF